MVHLVPTKAEIIDLSEDQTHIIAKVNTPTGLLGMGTQVISYCSCYWDEKQYVPYTDSVDDPKEISHTLKQYAIAQSWDGWGIF